MTSVFEELGLNKTDVKKWQTEKNLQHLSDKALCQIYLRIVKGKSFRPPNPLYTVQEVWEKIEKITNGQENRPASNKIYIGMKDLDIIALIKDVQYDGCPECQRGKKKLKKNFCTNHDGEPIPLVKLHITEWAVYDGEDQFSITLFGKMSAKYSEVELTGARVWAEGYIDLNNDPISLAVNNFRKVERNQLLGVGSFVEKEEEEIKVDISSVELEGFDDDEDTDNPFVSSDDVKVNPFEESIEKKTETGLTPSFITNIRKEMREMLSIYARKTSVPKDSVLRAMRAWVRDTYSSEFDDVDDFDEKLWESINGLYVVVDGDRVKYLEE